MWQRRGKRRREANAELNITAFMNLMVVLVPFLLITAVFSQVSILNLNLPGTGAPQTQSDEPIKALEVIVRKSRLEIAERGSGGFVTIDNNNDSYDFEGLNQALQKIKASPDFSEETAITLLLEENIEYDVLIQTMDAVRMVTREEEIGGKKTRVLGELFPDISIGSAPPAYDQKESQ